MSFDAAYAKTMVSERGYSNNPADKGGETIDGITVAVARAHGYTGPMREMPEATKQEIYRSGYWDLINLGDVDALSPAIAAEMFDTAVNMGVSIPVPFLQTALNAFNRQGAAYPDMPVDGLLGQRTVAALKAYLADRGAVGERVIVTVLNVEQGTRYLDIIKRDPSQETFAFGWFANRVAA